MLPSMAYSLAVPTHVESPLSAIRNLSLSIFAAMLLLACGNRGPLYLPDEPPPATTAGDTASDEDDEKDEDE